METLLGIAMIYAWIHSVIVISKKVTDLTQYEKVLLIVSLVLSVFYVIGTAM